MLLVHTSLYLGSVVSLPLALIKWGGIYPVVGSNTWEYDDMLIHYVLDLRGVNLSNVVSLGGIDIIYI